MKRVMLLLLLLTNILLMPNCYAKHLYKEAVYQDYWCNKHGGILEYELNDKSRVDCLLPDMAVEFDFALSALVNCLKLFLKVCYFQPDL